MVDWKLKNSQSETETSEGKGANAHCLPKLFPFRTSCVAGHRVSLGTPWEASFGSALVSSQNEAALRFFSSPDFVETCDESALDDRAS